MLKRCCIFLAALMLLICRGFTVYAVTAPTPPSLYSETAVLADCETGQILLDKDMHKRMYPASITKIMTCILAMERGDPDALVTVTQADVDDVPRNTTHIALMPGEQLPLRELEYAMMVPSANDAANAIASHIGGSLANFSRMMNEKAREIGAVNTHFVNAHGLPDPNHYTTAYDMLLITREAMKYPEFMRLAGTAEYTLPPTNLQPNSRFLHNRQYMITDSNRYPGAFAGKNGWTEDSGHTLVTLARRGGTTLVSIVLRADSAMVADAQFKDSTALLDYGFNKFKRFTLPESSFPTEQVVYTGKSGGRMTAALTAVNGVSVLLPEGASLSDIEIILPELSKTPSYSELSRASVKLVLPDELGLPPAEFALTLLGEQPLSPSLDGLRRFIAELAKLVAAIAVAFAGVKISVMLMRRVMVASYREYRARLSELPESERRGKPPEYSRAKQTVPPAEAGVMRMEDKLSDKKRRRR